MNAPARTADGFIIVCASGKPHPWPHVDYGAFCPWDAAQSGLPDRWRVECDANGTCGPHRVVDVFFVPAPTAEEIRGRIEALVTNMLAERMADPTFRAAVTAALWSDRT